MAKNDIHIADFFRDKGFSLKMGFGRKPAILVIDFMNAFTDPQMPLGADVQNELKETNRILKAGREAQVPIIFTVVYYDESMDDAGIWPLKQKGLSTLKKETPEVEIDSTLDVQKNDAILLKKYASAFFGTDLVSRLNAKNIDTLIITGCTTSGCVRATVVDAMQYGYRPIIVKEAVSDRHSIPHNQSLFDMNAKYGDVVSVDEVINYLNAQRR